MSSSALRVRVIKEGFIVRDGTRIVDASSSVTVVEAGGVVIVVDTGSPRDEGVLRRKLGEIGLGPSRVDFVVNTHLHVDHVGCNDLFKNARVCAHVAESPPAGALRISSDMTLAPGVLISPTPGHTPGSISVFVEGDKKYVVCGDAIPTKANYESMAPPMIHFDRGLAVLSMERILSWAEVVVPGHGPPFDVVRKK